MARTKDVARRGVPSGSKYVTARMSTGGSVHPFAAARSHVRVLIEPYIRKLFPDPRITRMDSLSKVKSDEQAAVQAARALYATALKDHAAAILDSGSSSSSSAADLHHVAAVEAAGIKLRGVVSVATVQVKVEEQLLKDDIRKAALAAAAAEKDARDQLRELNANQHGSLFASFLERPVRSVSALLLYAFFFLVPSSCALLPSHSSLLIGRCCLTAA